VYYLRYDLESEGTAAVFNCDASCTNIEEDGNSVGKLGTDVQISSGDVITLEIFPGESRISLVKDQSDSANKLVEYTGCNFANHNPSKVVATLRDMSTRRTSLTALTIEQPTSYFDVSYGTLSK